MGSLCLFLLSPTPPTHTRPLTDLSPPYTCPKITSIAFQSVHGARRVRLASISRCVPHGALPRSGIMKDPPIPVDWQVFSSHCPASHRTAKTELTLAVIKSPNPTDSVSTFPCQPVEKALVAGHW